MAGNDRETARRIFQAGERSAGTSASGTRRDAATGERRRRVAEGAGEREDARRLGRSPARESPRTTAHGGSILAECADARRNGGARRFRDQTARRRKWRAGLAADRLEISDGRLPALAGRAGPGRQRSDRGRDARTRDAT